MVKEALSPIFTIEHGLTLSDRQEEKLSEHSAWFEKMHEENLWFRERTPDELNQIIPDLQALAQGKKMLPWRALSSLIESGLVKADVANHLFRILWREVLKTIKEVALENIPDSSRIKVSSQATDRLTRALVLNLLEPSGFQDGYVDVFTFSTRLEPRLSSLKRSRKTKTGIKPANSSPTSLFFIKAIGA